MSFFKVTGASVREIVCLTHGLSLRAKEACSAPASIFTSSCKSTDTDLLDFLFDYWKWEPLPHPSPQLLPISNRIPPLVPWSKKAPPS